MQLREEILTVAAVHFPDWRGNRKFWVCRAIPAV
jgi:hypothetical protein